MEIRVVDEKGNLIDSPYILRLQGWSEERYFKEAPRERKCEFVHGEVIIMGPMGRKHSFVVNFLSTLLSVFVDNKGLGAVALTPTIRLLPGVNREPDICFYPKEMLPLSSDLPINEIPPFLAEVSFATRSIDLFEKAEDYAKAGVQEYWVVDLDQEELVVHLGQGFSHKESFRQGRVDSQVIHGFWIQAEWLFQEPLPNAWECLQQILGKSF